MMKNKYTIELNHYPRRSGKTHKLVNEIFDYIYKTNTNKTVLILTFNKDAVNYIGDIMTCNICYDSENCHREINDDLHYNLFIGNNYKVIITTLECMSAVEQEDICNSELVLLDELVYEYEKEILINQLFSKFKTSTIFKVFYTSQIGPIDEEMFELYKRYERKPLKFKEKYIKRYNEKLFVKNFNLFFKSIYCCPNIRVIIKEHNKIDYHLQNILTLNANDLSAKYYYQRYLAGSLYTDLFGIILLNRNKRKKVFYAVKQLKP